MKSFCTTTVLITALVVPMVPAQTQEREDRRTPRLVCAGGTDNMVNIQPDANVTIVEVTFDAAPTSWNESGGTLPYGTCTWLDRPLNTDEPRKFRMSLPMKGKPGFNPRSLFIPGQSPVSRADLDYHVNIGQRPGGLVLRISNFVRPTRNRPRGRLSEIGRIELTNGTLFTMATRNIGDAFQFGRIEPGPPSSEGIDLTSDDIEIRR